MLAYRDSGERVDTRREIARLRRAAASAGADADATLTLLIDVGMLEAALVDAVSATCDGWALPTATARDASVHAARVWLAAASGRTADIIPLVRCLDALTGCALPRDVTVRVPEGFAYYALFPETFAAAARNVQHEYGAPHMCVIGLRSIGTTLAAVVHAAGETAGAHVWSCTVRPRDHPFAREVRLGEHLSARLRNEAARQAVFVIADEGPGLSGSSFASAASALAGLGVPSHRIVLLPSWNAPPDSLNSAAGRDAWSRYRRFHVDAAAIGISPDVMSGGGDIVDYSAGRWREDLYGSAEEWPDVDPRHERWKVRLPRRGRLRKFVGLGSFGAAARERAIALADMGLGMRPGSLRQGFLDLPFVEGTPWTAAVNADAARVLGGYVARVAAAFPRETCVEPDALIEMIVTNLRELGGSVSGELTASLARARAVLASTRAVDLDGRMLPHEWIATASGAGTTLKPGTALKVDALDHHRDHFFPGPQHPAWDLAAVVVEFDGGSGWADAVLEAFESEGGDPGARALLPFYVLAYSAFRAGYASLSGLAPSRARYSQCALNAAASFTAWSKSPRKQIARSSMNT